MRPPEGSLFFFPALDEKPRGCIELVVEFATSPIGPARWLLWTAPRRRRPKGRI
jgi:hypothetical protein